jgi:hypothetical protein
LGKICPKIAKLIEFTLEKYICPKYTQFLFPKNKIIAYTWFTLLPTTLYNVVGTKDRSAGTSSHSRLRKVKWKKTKEN